MSLELIVVVRGPANRELKVMVRRSGALCCFFTYLFRLGFLLKVLGKHALVSVPFSINRPRISFELDLLPDRFRQSIITPKRPT